MSLIFSTFFFFLLNYSFEQSIDFDINCTHQTGNNYYNSLKYECTTCSGTKGYYSDTCYSSPNTKSIYTFEDITLNTCGDNQVFTELDEDQNLLAQPECANKDFNYDIDSHLVEEEISDGSITVDNNVVIYSYDKKIYNYYYHSCLVGGFERSCDFVANYFVLTLYSSNNAFFNILTELDKKLHENQIL